MFTQTAKPPRVADWPDEKSSLPKRWASAGVLKMTLLAYHHQNSTNACFLVAEAVKAFEALAPAANPTKRLTRSATGIRKWWRSARSV